MKATMQKFTVAREQCVCPACGARHVKKRGERK